MNVIASHLGIPSNAYRAIEDLKNGYKMTKKVNSLSCNNKMGFIYADGSIPLILEEFYRDKSANLEL